MAVDLAGTSPGGPFKRGTPQSVYKGLVGGGTIRNSFDLTKDNNRILVLSSQTATQQGTPPIVVILNWASGLQNSSR